MDTAFLHTKFARLGARLKLGAPPSRTTGAISLDVKSYGKGEFFEVAR